MDKYSFINDEYQLYNMYYKKITSRKNDLTPLQDALKNLKDDNKKVDFIEGLRCKCKISKYIQTLEPNEKIVAISEQALKCFVSGKLIAPIPIYYTCSPYTVIKSLNEHGFLVYWNEDKDDALVVCTEEVRNQQSFMYYNYNGSEVRINDYCDTFF